MTVIVLLILAVISFRVIAGENGLISKSETAASETEKQTATEIMNLKITNIQISSYAENQKLPTLQYLSDKLCEDGDMEYVHLKEQEQASLKKITVGDADSILAKLKKYPFEFEINSKLQLASIDGVQVASTSDVSELKEQLKNELKQEILNELGEELNPASAETVSREEYDALLTKISALETTGSTNPTGTIIAYSVNNVPSGYLKCEGQAVSRTEYSNLFNIIGTAYGSGDGSTTFNVPDLRGEFLRGTGTNSHSNQGNGTTVGLHQDATLSASFWNHGDSGECLQYYPFVKDSIGVQNWDYVLNRKPAYSKYLQISVTSYTFTNNIFQAYTSRPTNTSVLYCIKY